MTLNLKNASFNKSVIPSIYFTALFASFAWDQPHLWFWILVLPFLTNLLVPKRMVSLLLGFFMFLGSFYFFLAVIFKIAKVNQPAEFIAVGVALVVMNFFMSGWLVRNAGLKHA